MSSQMFAQQSPVRQYLPWICTSLAIGYAAYIHWRSRCQRKKIQINLDKKHARSCEVNIDDIDRNQTKKKISYCRCWKSETFPLCDGVHKCHNRENDDSVGPLNLVWRDDNVKSGDATTTAATDPTRQTESKSPINDPDMDIKSIDSLESDHSPILGVSGSANGSNGSDDFDDQLVKIDSNAAAGSSSSSNNKNNADVTTTTSTPNRSSNMNDDGHHSHNTSVNNNSNSNNLTDEQLSSLEMIDDDNNFTTVNNDNDNDGQQQQSTP